MASYYWIAYKTGTATNPVIVTTPTSGAEFTSFSQGNPTVINGTSYTVTTAGGPYSSQAAAQAGLARVAAAAGAPLPSNAVTSGWIIVPEGSVGEAVNALSVIGHVVNPAQLANAGSLSTDAKNALNDLAGIGKLSADATGGGTTQYTIEQLTTAGQVTAAQNSGFTVYPTASAAQAAANGQNASGSGQNALDQFLNNLGNRNTWIRIAKVVVGGGLVLIAVSHATGADNAIARAARKVPVIV